MFQCKNQKWHLGTFFDETVFSVTQKQHDNGCHCRVDNDTIAEDNNNNKGDDDGNEEDLEDNDDNEEDVRMKSC